MLRKLVTIPFRELDRGRRTAVPITGLLLDASVVNHQEIFTIFALLSSQ